LRERFCRPLGLGIRLPEDETEPVANLATGYWRGPRGWQRGRYGLHFSASGGLAGSALDLATWLQAVLAGRGPAAGLLARLGTRRHLTDGRATGYGLGLARSDIPDIIAIGHGGSLPGYKNHFLLAPEHNAGVVVLSNREDTNAFDISLDILATLAGASLPPPAPSALPEGSFLADDFPLWFEHKAGQLTMLGALETLYAGEDGFAEGRSAHLPVRLRGAGEVIEGEIGHVHRRFRRVTAGLAASASWAGRWVCPAQHAAFEIEVAGGVARLAIGVGPLHSVTELQPLAADTALLDRPGDGASRRRACLRFAGNEVRLVTSRARILRFRRA
jgi:hypothetical protein